MTCVQERKTLPAGDRNRPQCTGDPKCGLSAKEPETLYLSADERRGSGQDQRPGHDGELRPNKPCDLKTSGNFPSIVFRLLVMKYMRQLTVRAFNCSSAQRSDEVLICQSDELSALDRDLSSIYFRLRNNLLGAAGDQLQASQASCAASFSKIWRFSRFS